MATSVLSISLNHLMTASHGHIINSRITIVVNEDCQYMCVKIKYKNSYLAKLGKIPIQVKTC